MLIITTFPTLTYTCYSAHSTQVGKWEMEVYFRLAFYQLSYDSVIIWLPFQLGEEDVAKVLPWESSRSSSRSIAQTSGKEGHLLLGELWISIEERFFGFNWWYLACPLRCFTLTSWFMKSGCCFKKWHCKSLPWQEGKWKEAVQVRVSLIHIQATLILFLIFLSKRTTGKFPGLMAHYETELNLVGVFLFDDRNYHCWFLFLMPIK